MKKLVLFPALFIILFLIGYKVAVDSVRPEKISRSKILLGTVVDIQVRDKDEEKAAEAIEAAFNEIKRVEVLFSSRDREGGVYKLNKVRDSIVYLEEELSKLLQCSDSLWQLTNGAFDVSLQSLMDVWGFEDEPSLPSEKMIRKAVNESGWDNINLTDGGLIKHNNAGLNFGAIAKGYAVDRAVQVLKNHGIEDALVDAGGEIRITGGDWKVGVQDPDDEEGLLYILDLKGMSAATSGDYEQYFEQDGIRYHHILDPSTGYPGKKCRSVTVLSKENYFADGLATGVFIMGAEDGIALIEKIDNTEALIIDSQGKVWMSAGFNNYIVR
jgi:FAD:protein FMN transferase